jgi:hypothetical protein
MTKPDSGLFKDTIGLDDFYGDAESVIAARVAGLDLTPHPITQKQLSAKQMERLKTKIEDRTATKEEYVQYMWNKRFKKRHDKGVVNFWLREKEAIKNGREETRNWSFEQKEAILSGRRPKFNNRTIQGHHSYGVKDYPHLADKGAIIYPATHNEHLKGWHDGNYKNSLPGRRIRRIRDF